MTTEWGALAGVFPFDEVTVNYLAFAGRRVQQSDRPGNAARNRSGYTQCQYRWMVEESSGLWRIADAEYAIELELDLATLSRTSPGLTRSRQWIRLPEMERKRVPIQKAWLDVVCECAI